MNRESWPNTLFVVLKISRRPYQLGAFPGITALHFWWILSDWPLPKKQTWNERFALFSHKPGSECDNPRNHVM